LVVKMCWYLYWCRKMTGRHNRGNERASSCSRRHLGTLQHPPRGSCCQRNAWQLERRFGHYSENG
jgi:hypothetical protein